MRPLIVGIDPGTTSAVAAVNFDGELVYVESGRDISTSEMIEMMVEQGKAVVIASDKAKTPSKVKDICASLGCELFELDQDISRSKKIDLGRGDNPHEVDASAAAINAYNNLDKEIRKIKRISEDEDVSLMEASRNYFDDVPLPDS